MKKYITSKEERRDERGGDNKTDNKKEREEEFNSRTRKRVRGASIRQPLAGESKGRTNPATDWLSGRAMIFTPVYLTLSSRVKPERVQNESLALVENVPFCQTADCTGTKFEGVSNGLTW
jgi:hypothetical protein